MKTKLQIITASVLCSLLPGFGFSQTPGLGSTAGFAVFTKAGALTNTGITTKITGDIGTFSTTPSGFTTEIVTGTIYNFGDAPLATAASDVTTAYDQITAITNNYTLATPLENQVLTAGVYNTAGAATLNGNLTLDGQGNTNSVFVIKINGAFTVGLNSQVILVNSALAGNIYWQVGGQFDLGTGSVFKGTVLVNGAVNLLDGAALDGRILSIAGAISVTNNAISIPSNLVSANKSISDISGKNTVIPNPLNKSINITLTDMKKGTNYQFSVYNSTGIKLIDNTITAQSTSIGTQDLPVGIYLYQLMSNKKVILSGKFTTR